MRRVCRLRVMGLVIWLLGGERESRGKDPGCELYVLLMYVFMCVTSWFYLCSSRYVMSRNCEDE